MKQRCCCLISLCALLLAQSSYAIIPVFDAKGVFQMLNEIKQLSFGTPGEKGAHYKKETLYHDGHITDGRHGSWKDDLDPEFVRQIEDKYHDWFVINDYPLPA